MIAKNIQFAEDNQELIKPVLPGLPISVFYTTFHENTYNCINWHWHEAFQYCLVTEGAVDFLLSGTSYHVRAGQGIFINTQQVHFTRGRTGVPSSYLCVDIPPAFIYPDERSRLYQKYIHPVLKHPYPQVLLLSRQEEEQRILDAVQKIQALLREQPDYMELDIHGLVMEIWHFTCYLLKAHGGTAPFEVAENDRLKIILQYMQDHYAQKITLDEIAGQLHVSRSECCRFFKKATGQSMFSYLNNLRVNKSIDLLKDPDVSLADIATAVGFCNQSYYTDCFRKTKNITPRKYRELTLRSPRDVLLLDVDS